MSGECTLFRPLIKGPISEIIVGRITDALISGELKPGDKIPTEQEFSEKLGIGRNAVREAIKVLVAFGVLEIRRSEGTFVVEGFNQNLLNPMIYGLLLTNGSMKDVLEFKVALLDSILHLAIRNADDEEIAVLRQHWERFRDAMQEDPGDFQEMYQASKEYNRYIGQITHNPMIIQLNKIAMKVAKYTRVRAIESSLRRGQPNLLPDSYLKDLELVERRDKNGIPALADEKLELWKYLVL